MSEPLSFPRNSGVADLGFHSGSTNEIMDHPHRWTVDAMIQKLFGTDDIEYGQAFRNVRSLLRDCPQITVSF